MSQSTTLAGIALVLAILAMGFSAYMYTNPQKANLSILQENIAQNKLDIAQGLVALKTLDTSDNTLLQRIESLEQRRNDFNGNLQDDIDDNHRDIRDILDCADSENNYSDFVDCMNDI